MRGRDALGLLLGASTLVFGAADAAAVDWRDGASIAALGLVVLVISAVSLRRSRAR